VPVAAILLSLWGAGALVASLAFARDANALRTLLAEGAPSDRPATVAAIAQRLGLARLPRVRRSAGVSVPAVAGWLRPTLVLPEDGRADEAALIHELAHVQRGDVPTLAGARLTAAVWWWHPLAWLMLRGLAATAEEACDDVVLALTGARREYAQMLTAWAERATLAGAVSCGSRGRGLVARVRRVLDERVRPVVGLSARARAIVAAMTMCVVIVSASMHVRAADEAPAMAAGIAETEGKEVVIAGRVVSPDGSPVAGAAVYTYYQPISPAGRSPWPWTEARTDQAGLFRMVFTTGKVSGAYPLVAFRDGLAAGWQLVEPGTDAEICMRPDPAPCEGAVRDAGGQPVGGAEVRLAFLNLETADGREHVTFGSLPVAITRSDNAGRFSIPGLPRGAEVWMATTAEGHACKWGPDARPAVVGTPFTITLPPEARISGRVVHEGQPVAGITVGAHSQTDVLAPNAITDEAGRFELGQLPAGTYAVTAVSSDEYIARPVREITLATGEHRAHVQIDVLAPAVIEGRLTDADSGDPVEGARVEASDQSWTITPEARRLATSDADGRYSLRVLPGHVPLRCLGVDERYPWNMVTPERLSLDVSEGQVLSGVDFSLTPIGGGTIIGRVIAPEGDEIDPVLTVGWEPGGSRRNIASDGTYRIEHARPGSGFVFTFGSNRYVSVRTPNLTVREGETTEAPPLELKYGGWIAGRIEGGPQGQDIRYQAYARLQTDQPLYLAPGTFAAAFGPDFRLGPLTPGEYRVEAVALRWPSGEKTGWSAMSATVTVELGETLDAGTIELQQGN
jgi:uncharacterized GH25 family protein